MNTFIPIEPLNDVLNQGSRGIVFLVGVSAAVVSLVVLFFSFSIFHAVHTPADTSNGLQSSLLHLSVLLFGENTTTSASLLLGLVAGFLAIAFAGLVARSFDLLQTFLLGGLYGMVVWFFLFFVLLPILLARIPDEPLFFLADEWFLPFLVYGVSLVSVKVFHLIFVESLTPTLVARTRRKDTPWWLTETIDLDKPIV